MQIIPFIFATLVMCFVVVSTNVRDTKGHKEIDQLSGKMFVAVVLLVIYLLGYFSK